MVGVSKLGDRSFVNAVVYVLKTGAPWRDLPERFGPWKSVYNRFSNWGSKAGRWRQIFKALQLKVGPPWKPGRCDDRAGTPGFGGSKRGPAVNCLGRSRGGFSTKVHALSDAQGRPIHVELTAGQTHEATVAAALLEHADGRAFIGDTGYDAERIRAAAAARGMRVVIPSHPTRATEHRLDKKLYRDPLPHRVSVSPPQALSSARDPLRKDRSQLPCVRPIWGLRSDLDQHALMPRNCIPGTDETSGCSTMRSWTCISARSNSSPVPCALLSACPAARLPWRTQLRRAAVSIPLNIAEGGGPKPRVRGPRQVPRHRSRLCNGVGRFARRHSSVQRRAPRGLGPRQVSLGPRRRNAQQDVLRPPPRGRGRGRIRGRGRGRGRAPRQIGTPPSPPGACRRISAAGRLPAAGPPGGGSCGPCPQDRPGPSRDPVPPPRRAPDGRPRRGWTAGRAAVTTATARMLPGARRHRRRDRVALGAHREPIRGVLQVAADVDAVAFVEHGRAHPELRVGGAGVPAHLAGRPPPAVPAAPVVPAALPLNRSSPGPAPGMRPHHAARSSPIRPAPADGGPGHVLVAQPPLLDPRRRVGHQRQPEHGQSGVARADHLVDGRHPDQPHAQDPQHAHLGRRLVGGAGHAGVDPLAHRLAEQASAPPRRPARAATACRRPPCRRSGDPAARRWDRSGAKLPVRFTWSEMATISPTSKRRVHPARDVGDHHRVGAQRGRHPHGEAHLAGAVPLVGVDPAAQDQGLSTLPATHDQPARVAGHRGLRKPGQRGVRARPGRRPAYRRRCASPDPRTTATSAPPASSRSAAASAAISMRSCSVALGLMGFRPRFCPASAAFSPPCLPGASDPQPAVPDRPGELRWPLGRRPAAASAPASAFKVSLTACSASRRNRCTCTGLPGGRSARRRGAVAALTRWPSTAMISSP